MRRLRNKPVAFKKQHYSELRKHHQDHGTLFTDLSFPAVDSVIGTSSIPPNVQWKRPHDICTSPRLFLDIETSRTVRPGELSCNWMVSACAVLAGVQQLCNKVIPNYWEQEWDEQRPERYCGIFHFQLWQFGEWTDVVVDDLLPMVENTLLGTQAGSQNEFWSALLEKAYAKLHGSYDALREGHLCDALVDFTGGVSQVIELQAADYAASEDKRLALLEMLFQEIANHSIMCFSVMAPNASDIGTRTELGLNRGHAYHVTDVKKVHLNETSLRHIFKGREKVAMVRLRDPRGEVCRPPSATASVKSTDKTEYAYTTPVLARLLSKNSEWSYVKESERQRLGLDFTDKSEFWMPLEDVVSQFTELAVCRLLTHNLFATAGRRWHEAVGVGRWTLGVKGTSADRSGGGEPFSETTLRNPQYLCNVEEGEEVVIQLMQWHDPERIEQEPTAFLNFLIGFSIIKVEMNRSTRLHKQWPHCPTLVELDHKRKREVTYHGYLAPGRYILLLTTYKAGDEANYLLRLFSRSDLSLRELKEDSPQDLLPCSCLTPQVEWVTVITVNRAEGLTKPDRWTKSSLSPYCVVACEGKKWRTPVAKNDAVPTWNCSFVFYRKKVDRPLVIQVYSRNSILRDELIGEAELPAPVTHSPTPLSTTLLAPHPTAAPESTTLPAPTIHLVILTEDNLLAV